MKKLLMGYGRTLVQYLQSAKGHHDTFDYARGAIIIILVCAVLIYLLRFIGA